MDGKQLEERKALKEAVESLDALRRCRPMAAFCRTQPPLPSKWRRPLQLRRRYRLRKSTA